MNIEFTSNSGTVFRLVVIQDGEEELRYVTNNWDLTPLHVHMCYKQRWSRKSYQLPNRFSIMKLIIERGGEKYAIYVTTEKDAEWANQRSNMQHYLDLIKEHYKTEG